jgi:hypothetical protein
MATTRRFIRNSIGCVRSTYDPADLLDRARAKEEQASEALIIHFTPLAMAIAGRYAYKFPYKDLDILSEAILALTADVKRIIADESITAERMSPRLHLVIRGAILNFVRNDSGIKPPDTKEFRKLAKEDPEGDHYLLILPSLDDPRCAIDAGYNSAHYDIYIRDLLEHPDLLPIESKIISYCLDGYSNTEIAELIGYSGAWVGQIRKSAGAKIKRIIARGK